MEYLSPSYLKIAVFFLLIGIIFTILKTVSFFATRILKRQLIRSLWNRYFGVFELVFWIFFGLLSIEYFSVYNKLIAIILSVILCFALIILLYYYFKEVLIKVFFKLTTDIKVGDEVKNDEIAGNIIQIGSTQVVIERTDGSRIGIPYSKIIFNALIKQSPSPYLHRFECNLVLPVHADRNIFGQKIAALLLNDIRVSASVVPKVTFSNLNEMSYQIKVIAFVFDTADMESLREKIRSVLPE